ncbi:hypothetical protein DFH09DRAFT_1082259 [Mycena vulgaris]|nr:hypothetical protein DFH09DRAFT_1082259 [Mycena vulgaris]
MPQSNQTPRENNRQTTLARMFRVVCTVNVQREYSTTIAPERGTSEQDEHSVHPADSPRYPGCNHHHKPVTDRQRLRSRQLAKLVTRSPPLFSSPPSMDFALAHQSSPREDSTWRAFGSDNLIVPLAHANRLKIKAFAIELFCAVRGPTASGYVRETVPTSVLESRMPGIKKSWYLTMPLRTGQSTQIPTGRRDENLEPNGENGAAATCDDQ